MSVEENKALVRRLLDGAFNKGNLTLIDELVAKDWVYHRPTDQVVHGPESYKQVVIAIRTAMPDLLFTVDDIFAEGDKVVYRFTGSGTFTGEWQGITPNNKKVTIWGIAIEHIIEGKIVETWERYNTLGMMQQLGVIPPMGKR